ncbi:MAG: hypothetical protein ACPIOQ_33840 [Promethearchaeia archaeon]
MKLPETSRQRSEEACYADGVVFLSSSAWEADPLMQAVRLSLMGSERVKTSNIHSMGSERVKSSNIHS